MPRCILVTGSSSGIGQAITRHLLKLGHRVIGISRREQKEESDNFTHYQIDLADIDTLPEKLKMVEKAHPDIDFVLLNAGQGHLTNIEELSYEQIDKLLSFNLTQYAFVTKAFLPTLKKKDHANIVYIASTSGRKGSKRFSIYCASKFGVCGLAESIRDECKTTNVHVTILSPGMVRTPFFDTFDLGPSDHPYEAIEPEDFHPIMDLLLNLRHGSVIEEIVIRPMRSGIKKPSAN